MHFYSCGQTYGILRGLSREGSQDGAGYPCCAPIGARNRRRSNRYTLALLTGERRSVSPGRFSCHGHIPKIPLHFFPAPWLRRRGPNVQAARQLPQHATHRHHSTFYRRGPLYRYASAPWPSRSYHHERFSRLCPTSGHSRRTLQLAGI